MTDRDYDTYQFIISYIKENGYPPTVREIAHGINITSTSAVCERLSKLEKAGCIKTKLASPRAIKVIGYEFRKKEDDTMRDTNKESLAIKAEFKQQYLNAIKERFTPEELKVIEDKLDLVFEKFSFHKNAVHK